MENKTDHLVEHIRRRVWALIRHWDLPLLHIEMEAKVSKGTLSRFLHEARGNEPSMRWLLSICVVLRCDYGWLVTGKTPDPTKAYHDLKLEPVPARLRVGRPPLSDGITTVQGGRTRHH